MWNPLEPEVFTQLGSPSSSSRSRSRKRCSAQHACIVDRRIQVEHTDVRVVHVRRARCPHVRRDAVLVDKPQQRPRVRDDWMVHDAVLLGNLDALQPFRKPFRHILLNKSLLADAGRKAFHRDGTTNDVRQHHGRDHLVVSGEFAFRNPVIREQHLFGMGDHHVSLTTSRGDLSYRTPSSRGWRSLPCTVHSMNATCTTISGRTQCARMRGSPLAFVNGDSEISSLSSRARRSSNSLVSKPVPILPAKTKSVPIEVSHQQRAETDAAALRIRESANDEFLRRLALHLQPVRRAAVLVR